MSALRTSTVCLVVALLLAGCGQQTETESREMVAAPELIPRAEIFGNPDKALVRISPDGSKISYVAAVDGVLNVWVGPADDPSAARAVTHDTYRGIRRYNWAQTNNHIVYLQDKGGDENWRAHSVDLTSGDEKDLTPMAGIRADMEVATQPTTASGYWMRSVLTNYMPKMMMAAAVAGFYGDDLEEWFSHIASYDLEKYMIIPVPPFYSKSKEGKKKAVYLRVPHDDTSRILAAVMWALVMGPRPNAAAHAVSTLAGEFPGISPTFSIPMAGLQAMAGRNPWDAFRGRPMVPRTEWDAGGWARWKEMGRKTLGEFGVLSQLGGHWLYASPEEGETVPGEVPMRAIPGLSSIIKISDRGLNESRYWEIDWETQDRARLRLDLTQDVRKRTRKRNRLNRFGVERLSRREEIERDRLNRWYRRFYMPQTERMQEMKDRMKDAQKRGERASVARSRRRYEQARDRLNASIARTRR